ncbi:MAG TPA: class II aldolase/adducin family protein [Alphaproteobacteria bacterium]|jgi:ribulose-5-phosphate 4-epimerase/fuculose-1-phosphate aldolase|nr:class II aldolase/adducin family protein [Alphaproteobacteria bacterium]
MSADKDLHAHGDHHHSHTHVGTHAHTENDPQLAIGTLEADLKIASTILEWESGDIFGHVGVRLPGGDGIACKLFREPGARDEDWLVHFDFNGKKIGGVGTPPLEAPIYTEILKRRPDVRAVVHTHSPACVALSLADKQISAIHMQSAKFGYGVPIYPRPIHIKDMDEGNDLAKFLADGRALVIKGHGVVAVGDSIDEACMNALYLERTAKIQGLAISLGFQGPTREFQDEILESRRRLLSMDDNKENRGARGGYSNEWMYFRKKIMKGERWNRGWS